MATPKPLKGAGASAPVGMAGLKRYLPFLDWLFHYRRQDLVGDLMAGIIVTIMLVPQSMAYALLAGLPPQVGLYASIVPLIIYGLLGTSRTLAVGPVAIMSLLTAAAIGQLAEAGSADYVTLALILALLLGGLQILMGLFRVGFLVNFLSHPVLSGFTSAAAIVIGTSQLKHIMGISIPSTESVFELLRYAFEHAAESNLLALGIGLGGVAILFYFKDALGRQLKRMGVADALIVPITRGGPLVLVILGTLLVWGLQLGQTAGIKVVGSIPAGLPPLTVPTFDWARWQALLPTAITLAFVGFMESISVAKSLASKRRQKVDADQELLALGAANVGAAFTGGYPVTGGFSRSVVNFTAGANTGLASMITAGLIALTVIFLTPIFYFLPQAVLAAIVIVAVSTLVDLKTPRHVWHYNKADAAAWLITFVAVLAVGVETGIIVGVIATVVLYLWRTSRPHIAIVGQVGATETYRNVLRHEVKTCPHVVAVRVDESLYFANTKYMEDTLLRVIAERPEVKHLLLIGSAVNFIDFSALETLEALRQELRDAGVQLHLADIKGPVMDRLKTSGFIEHIGADHVYLSTHEAMMSLKCV
jgi:SulP family sulfate permease